MKNKLFKFSNSLINSDTICEKTGKVLEYKEIYVVEKNEMLARKKACRSKLDLEGLLNSAYDLISVKDLGVNWN